MKEQGRKGGREEGRRGGYKPAPRFSIVKILKTKGKERSAKNFEKSDSQAKAKTNNL